MSKRTREETSASSLLTTPQPHAKMMRSKTGLGLGLSILNYININKSQTEIILDAKRKWIKFRATKETSKPITSETIEKILNEKELKSFHKSTSGDTFDYFLHFIVSRKDIFNQPAIEIIITEWISQGRNVLEINKDGLNPINIAQNENNLAALQTISKLCPIEYYHNYYLATPAQKKIKNLLKLVMNSEEPSSATYYKKDIALFKQFKNLYKKNSSSFAQICENYGLEYIPLPAKKLKDPLTTEEKEEDMETPSTNRESEQDSSSSPDYAKGYRDEILYLSPKSSSHEEFYLNSGESPCLSLNTTSPLTFLFDDYLESFD